MLDRIVTLMEGVRGVSDAIAHDLRTPIARARAKLEEALAAAGRPRRRRARRCARRWSRASPTSTASPASSSALLRIAEAEAGARRAAFATFDLVPVLADAGEIYEAAAEARGQRLDHRTAGQAGARRRPRPDPAGGGEPARQRHQVHAPRRRACGSPPLPPTRTPRLAPPSRWWWRTTAPGMPPADRGKAGQRFFRADASRATPGIGPRPVAGAGRGGPAWRRTGPGGRRTRR